MSGMKLVAVLVVVALVAATSLVVAVPFQKNSVFVTMSRAKRMLESLGIKAPKLPAARSLKPVRKPEAEPADNASSLSSFTASEKRILNPEYLRRLGKQRAGEDLADTSLEDANSRDQSPIVTQSPKQDNTNSGRVPSASIKPVDKVKQWLFRSELDETIPIAEVTNIDVRDNAFGVHNIVTHGAPIAHEVIVHQQTNMQQVQGAMTPGSVDIEFLDLSATPAEAALTHLDLDIHTLEVLVTPDAPINQEVVHHHVQQVEAAVTPEADPVDATRGGVRKELFPTLDQDQLDNFDPEDTMVLPFDPIELEVEVNPDRNKKRRTNFEAGTPTKKKKVRMENWQDSKRKAAHNSGKEYVNKRGQKIKARVMKPACLGKCRRGCLKIHENTRQELFRKYWNIEDKNSKWLFISKLTKKVQIKSRTVSLEDPDEDDFHRKFSYEYYLPDENDIPVQVCQKMFLNTFDISVTVTKSAHTKNSPDKRGKFSNQKKRLPEELVRSVKEHIKSFPVVESHYCRKDSKKEYLDGHLSVAKMHRLYMMQRGENVSNTANLRQYRDIFNGSFNLSFHKPKKDLCSFCVEYDGLSEEQRNDPDKKKAYDTHISDKELARQLKREDKAASREEGSNIKVLTFDLQKVFFCPHCDVGECFYKRKISCYNFTIFDCTTKTAHCYVWDQTIGGRESGEFASAVLNFMESEVANNGIKEFDFYSDSCSSQNKNQFLFSMYYIAAMKFDIKIRHRYLMKGHTQMECDSVHGRIEKKTFRQQIYTPAQWYGHIGSAKVQRPPYKVKEVKREEIFCFKEIAKESFKWSKFGVSKFRELVIDSKKPGKATFREDLTSDPKEVDVLIRKRGRPYNWNTFQPPLAHSGRIPLKPKLIKDLKYYIKNNYIPAAHHAFYLAICEPVPDVVVEDDDDIPQEINPDAVYEEHENDVDDPGEQDEEGERSNFNENIDGHDSD